MCALETVNDEDVVSGSADNILIIHCFVQDLQTLRHACVAYRKQTLSHPGYYLKLRSMLLQN